MEFDQRDGEILQDRLAKWSSGKGPRVGDWCIMLDGTVRRFSHDWGDQIQTTHPEFGIGSFFFGNGYMSYSGSLDSAIAKNLLVDTGEEKDGRAWFFHHDFWGAHRGVEFNIPCKVYREIR